MVTLSCVEIAVVFFKGKSCNYEDSDKSGEKWKVADEKMVVDVKYSLVRLFYHQIHAQSSCIFRVFYHLQSLVCWSLFILSLIYNKVPLPANPDPHQTTQFQRIQTGVDQRGQCECAQGAVMTTFTATLWNTPVQMLVIANFQSGNHMAETQRI